MTENRIIDKESNQQLVSAEVQEIVSYKPHWIVRRGNFIFFLVLSFLLALSCIIEYPDLVNGSLRLVAVNPPKLLVASSAGKLEKLLVSNEESVRKGQLLAFLQSTASHDQVLRLRKWVDSIEKSVIQDNYDVLLFHPIPVLSSLGDLQQAYQDFCKVQSETSQLLANGYYQQKKKALHKDIEFLRTIRVNSEQQALLMREEFELQKIELAAKEKLAAEKVIAPLEFNQDRGKFLLKEQNVEQMEAQIVNSKLTGHNKQKEILDLQKYFNDQKLDFKTSLFSLKSRIEEWMRQYAVIAPEDGKLLFISFLQENQLLQTDQELFYLQPERSTYFGDMLVPQSGLGKVKAGQDVIIKLESYPATEFGYLPGKVRYISDFPGKKDSFSVKVDLPSGLWTNQRKKILFRNNLLASAQIITNNRKLSDRFWGQLTKAIRQ
jgi:HlyD family secretion protein